MESISSSRRVTHCDEVPSDQPVTWDIALWSGRTPAPYRAVPRSQYVESSPYRFDWRCGLLLLLGFSLAIAFVYLGDLPMSDQDRPDAVDLFPTIEATPVGLLLFTRMKEEEVSNHPTRRRILESIRDSPGTHLRELSRNLGMPLGTLRYHLDVLEHRGLLRTWTVRGLRKYAIHGLPRLPPYVNLTSRERQVLDYLAQNPGSRPREVGSALGISQDTARYHLHFLVAFGLAGMELVGRAIVCYASLEI